MPIVIYYTAVDISANIYLEQKELEEKIIAGTDFISLGPFDIEFTRKIATVL